MIKMLFKYYKVRNDCCILICIITEMVTIDFKCNKKTNCYCLIHYKITQIV